MESNTYQLHYVNKKLTVQLLGTLHTLELLPDLEAPEHEDQFTTKYKGQYVELDMAASKLYRLSQAETNHTSRNIEGTAVTAYSVTVLQAH